MTSSSSFCSYLLTICPHYFSTPNLPICYSYFSFILWYYFEFRLNIHLLKNICLLFGKHINRKGHDRARALINWFTPLHGSNDQIWTITNLGDKSFIDSVSHMGTCARHTCMKPDPKSSNIYFVPGGRLQISCL